MEAAAEAPTDFRMDALVSTLGHLDVEGLKVLQEWLTLDYLAVQAAVCRAVTERTAMDAAAVEPFDWVKRSSGDRKHKGKLRGRYGFVLAGSLYMHGFSTVTEELTNRFAWEEVDGTPAHIDKVLASVRRVVDHEVVSKFMVGKTSSSSAKHVYTGMVNRFGDKYHVAGYQAVFGVWLRVGDRVMESVALKIESGLHSKLQSHSKYDSDLSTDFSGRKIDDDAKRLFVVYIAIRYKGDQHTPVPPGARV
jgi:hypothetical protein